MAFASLTKLRWIALIVLAAVVIESVSSLLLFSYHSYKNTPFAPEGTPTTFILSKALGGQPEESFEADKPEMFRPDSLLGYTTNRGRYNIIETTRHTKHAYRVTLTDDGVRAASYRPVRAPNRIYILGNSLIWTVGLDDEMTAAWLLQARLPTYELVNLATTGYSDVQQWLQYQKLKETLQPDDIVVFSYSMMDLVHNVADAKSIQKLSGGYEFYLSNRDAFRTTKIPYASLGGDGKLSIKYTKIFCDIKSDKDCVRDTPQAPVLESIAIKIFSEIMRDRKAHILVAFMDGNDDDAVISHLRSSGVPIADLRVKPGPDDGDFLPGEEGGHRGAFTNFQYYQGLLAALSENHMLLPGDGF